VLFVAVLTMTTLSAKGIVWQRKKSLPTIRKPRSATVTSTVIRNMRCIMAERDCFDCHQAIFLMDDEGGIFCRECQHRIDKETAEKKHRCCKTGEED